MKKIFSILAIFCSLSFISIAQAQLPDNPWKPNAPKPNDGYFGDNLQQKPLPNTPSAPAYQGGQTNGEILPVDPWAKARDRSGTQTWRGSGKHGELNYVGEATTYGTAMGQEMIAPEVNRHNMLVATEHLRKLGYKIPKDYDNKIKNMPKAYAAYLREAYDSIGAQTMDEDPLGALTAKVMYNFETGMGLDFENLLFNSIDILATD